MKLYKDIFVEVHQRLAAFRYWLEFWNTTEYFIFTTASKTFLKFCAKKEGMSFGKYCKMLEVDPIELIQLSNNG